MNSVLIIGAGWLGKKAGEVLADMGMQVSGTTRSEAGFTEIREAGMKPYILDVTPGVMPYLPGADTIIISISPGRGKSRDNYPAVIETLSESLVNRSSQVIMFSSTSVYNGLNGLVREEDRVPDPMSENILLSAEGILHHNVPNANIMRLGGLYGEDRHPVYSLQDRKNIPDGDAPVNLIHSGDIISVIKLLIKNRLESQVLNVVCPYHPTKREYYVKKALEFELPPPEFREGGKNGKKADVSKLTEELGFSFLYCDLQS